MSLVLSPQTLEMSTTTSACATPTVDTIHVSPRLRPPPQNYHGSSRESNGSDSKNTRNKSFIHRNFTKLCPLIDPFLAQYIKSPESDPTHFYLKSLNKRGHIKHPSFYEKYLVHRDHEAPAPSSQLLKKSLLERKQVFSPVRKSPIAQTLDVNMTEDDASTPSRRRRYTGSGPSTPQVPTKKAHPKVITNCLPKEFMQCDIDDLVCLISRMLQSLINLNDRSVPESIANPRGGISDKIPAQRNKLLTRYHSRSPPAISIQTYLARLTKFNNFSQATLLTTIYYIDLLSHNFQPYFTLNSWTVHRFLLVATMLAQKALEDFFYTNDHYAKVGGVALTELNCLELDFLNRVDWKLVPAKQILNNKTSIKYYREVLDLYYVQLVNLMERNTSEHTNVVYTFSNLELDKD